MTHATIGEIAMALKVDIDTIYWRNTVINSLFHYKDYVWWDISAPALDFITFTNADAAIAHYRTQIRALIASRKWGAALNLIDKRVIWHAYQDFYEKLAPEERYPLFREVWQQSEYGFCELNRTALTTIFNFRKEAPDYPAFQETLRKLPLASSGRVKVWRGVGSKSQINGISWTTNPDIAKWFAGRFNQHGKIYTATVNLCDIVDIISDRNEDEILVMPGSVKPRLEGRLT